MREGLVGHLATDAPTAPGGRSTADYEPPALTLIGSLSELTLQMCDPADPTCNSGGIP